MSKVEFWERDGKGELLPKEFDIKITNKLVEKKLAEYLVMSGQLAGQLSRLSLEEGKEEAIVEFEKKKAVYDKVVEDLKVLASGEEKTMTIKFVPLVNYELKNVLKPDVNGKSIGCDGNPVDDQNADICAKHCVNPLHSYDEWKVTKDARIKAAIAATIFDNSIPDETDEEKEVKKKIASVLKAALSTSV